MPLPYRGPPKLECLIPSTQYSTPPKNRGLVGDLHLFGTMWEVFNIRGMGLMDIEQ